jgi:magnesium transporter
VWLDLHAPTPAENKLVEQSLHIALPTREEMQEIEITSRLYVDGARYMTATLMCNSDSEAPRTTPVTVILAPFRKAIRITPCEPCPRASRKNLKGTPAGKWHLF